MGLVQAGPTPISRSKFATVVGFWLNPGGRPMTGRVLPGHDGRPRRRADRMGVETGKPGSRFRQFLHVRRAVEFI